MAISLGQLKEVAQFRPGSACQEHGTATVGGIVGGIVAGVGGVGGGANVGDKVYAVVQSMTSSNRAGSLISPDLLGLLSGRNSRSEYRVALSCFEMQDKIHKRGT